MFPFEDSIAFRVEYEERYRDAWDRGAEGASKALVLHLWSGSEPFYHGTIFGMHDGLIRVLPI